MRKNPLVNGEIYHICTKSIAGYTIMNNKDDFEKMRRLIKYYSTTANAKFSDFIISALVEKEGFHRAFNIIKQNQTQLVQIIAYCFMPTHIHLILKQLASDGISKYMKDTLISYTRSFNTTHQRKGPLWESRFRSILVSSDEQLLHLTRYLHLNAVTVGLVDSPDKWLFSSYKEYLSKGGDVENICQFDDILEIKPTLYRKFVLDQIGYQKELAKIKKLILD